MKNTESQLQIIQECLNEVAILSANESLQEILSSLSPYKDSNIQFENYFLGSHTLGDKNTAHETLQRIQRSALRPRLDSFAGLLLLNQSILGAPTCSPRTTALLNSFHFPAPEVIEEGMALLFAMLHEDRFDLFVRRVAFVQGLISLHPFADGNHRTARLTLDLWLQQMELPTTRLKHASDFIFTNSVDQKLFSLEDAVQKVLYCMGNTLNAVN